MKWIKVENYEAMSLLGAEKIYQAIAEKIAQGKQVNIGLATGNTMIRLYELLAERLNRNRIPLHLLHTWNLDEYAQENGRAVPVTHPLSYRRYMTEHLFRRFDPALGFSEANSHFPDPASPERFDRSLENAGGTDLQLLGIGFRNFALDFVFELFLKSHDELDRIERISAEITHEGRFRRELLFIDAELFDDDFFDALFDCFV